MGMNDEFPATPASLDDLAAHALDAHEPRDRPAIEAHLATAPGAVRTSRTMRDAAGEYAAAVTAEVPPPAALRDRVLAASRRLRAPEPVVAGASPVDVHRVELARAVLLLADLRADDWSRPVDPPEFSGWTVHDVAAHLVANESLLAHHLGVPVAGVPETALDNEGRTAAARGRHRTLPPAAAVAELELAAEAVDDAVAARGEAGLDDPIEWWGQGLAIRTVLFIRAVEAWTHADDVRRAVGAPMVAPPVASLLTMTHAACTFVPGMLAARSTPHPDRLVRFRFPDLGESAAWEVDLGEVGAVRPAGDDRVDAEIAVDSLSFCRSVSARLPDGLMVFHAEGDEELIRDVVDALPVLAVL
jgi:uncharacterized protein (TIGR03083 family)